MYILSLSHYVWGLLSLLVNKNREYVKPLSELLFTTLTLHLINLVFLDLKTSKKGMTKSRVYWGNCVITERELGKDFVLSNNFCTHKFP